MQVGVGCFLESGRLSAPMCGSMRGTLDCWFVVQLPPRQEAKNHKFRRSLPRSRSSRTVIALTMQGGVICPQRAEFSRDPDGKCSFPSLINEELVHIALQCACTLPMLCQ